MAESSTEHCARRRKLTSTVHNWMKFKDNIGQQKQVANECSLNHSCKVNIQYLHTVFCLGIHTHVYTEIYMYIFIYSKSTKDNMIILKTNCMIVIISEKV